MKSRTVLDVRVVDLTFPGYMDWWHERARRFEERHPDFRVEIHGLGFFTSPREVSEAVARGETPALTEYYFYLNQVARDVRTPDGAPQFTSVQGAVDGRREILGEPVVLHDIDPALREYHAHDGDLFSMPSVGTTTVLYGNADLLDAAGVARLPRTWEEVEDACRAVAALPDGPSHGITWSNHGMLFQQALAVQGGPLADHGNGRSARATSLDLASPQMMAWVDWWRRMHRAGHHLYTGEIPDWQGTFEAFAEGRTAMRISSSNDIAFTVRAAAGAGFRLDVGRYPHNGAVPFAGNAVAGSSFWLGDRLDDRTRDGALAFLQFAHNPHNAADRHREHGFLPLTGAAVDVLVRDGWFDAHPYHRVPGEQLATHPPGSGADAGRPPVHGAVFGEFARVQDIMTRAMHDVLVDDVDPAGRFARATTDARRLLDAYNAAAPAVAPGGPDGLRVEYFTGADAYSGADLADAADNVGRA